MMTLLSSKYLLLLTCLAACVFRDPAAARPNEADANVCEVQPSAYNSFTINKVPGASYPCCLCPKGTYYSGPCTRDNVTSTKCLPCEFIDGDVNRQFYMNLEPHTKQTCNKSQGKCKSNEYRIQGSRIANAQCKVHTKCEPGFGVVNLGTTTNDTECEKCKKGYESPSLSAIEVCTKINKIVTTTSQPSIPTSTVLPTTIQTTALLATTVTPSSQNGAFPVVVIVVIVLGIIIFIILFVCRKRLKKCCKKKRPQEPQAANEAEHVLFVQLPPENGRQDEENHNLGIQDSPSPSQSQAHVENEPLLPPPRQEVNVERPVLVVQLPPENGRQDEENHNSGTQDFPSPSQSTDHAEDEALLTSEDEKPGPSHAPGPRQDSSSGLKKQTKDPQHREKMEKVRQYLDEAILNKDLVFRMFRHFRSRDEQFLSNASDKSATVSEFFNECHNHLLQYGWQHYNTERVIEFFRSRKLMLHVEKIEELLNDAEDKESQS